MLFLFILTEGVASVTLEQLLVFVTGADCIPPLGFDPQPMVEFLHDAIPSIDGKTHYVSKYPVTSTCSNTIMLPLSETYDIFKFHLEDAIIMSPGFGRV